MEGFIVIDWHEKYLEEFWQVMPELVHSGKLKYLEHVYSFEHAPQAMTDIMTGDNLGKTVISLETSGDT